MTARDEISKLTNAWYGFGLFSGILTVVMNGIGVFSILGAAFSTITSFVMTYVIGRLLLNRSGLTRFVVVVFAGLGSIFGVLGTGRCVYGFFSEWSLTMLVMAGLTLCGVWMNVRSLRVLLSKPVRAYFAG